MAQAEILEAHIISCLQPVTKHLIMIGDHKQLRPKLDDYKLSVASGNGHDFNRSLFERLVLEGSIQYSTLAVQHRMHPDISRLIRPTYPELQDAERVSARPIVRGLKSRVVFITHDQPGVLLCPCPYCPAIVLVCPYVRPAISQTKSNMPGRALRACMYIHMRVFIHARARTQF